MRSYLIINQSCERQIIKEIGEEFPNVRIAILPQALVVETIDLSDLSTFMISTEDRHSISVTDLEGHQERDGLDRVITSIHVISHEEVIGVR